MPSLFPSKQTPPPPDEPLVIDYDDPRILDVMSQEHLRYILMNAAHDQLVVAMFYEDGCESCFKMKPVYKALVETYQGVLFVRGDIYHNYETSLSLNLKYLPTFLCFKNSIEEGRKDGENEEDLIAMVASLA